MDQIAFAALPDPALLNSPEYTDQAKALTLADVIAHLEAHPAQSLRRQRGMLSALRTTARVLGQDPAAVPADPRQLRLRFQAMSTVSAGINIKRWNNVRSLLLAALKAAGVRVMPGRALLPLKPSWEAMRCLLPDAGTRHGLSRLMSFCSVRDISPATIDMATFTAFLQAMEEDSLVRGPGTVYRRAGVLWNQAARDIAGWPDFIVTLPGNSRRYALDWSDFPESFQTDAKAFLHQKANQDPFADDYVRSIRPTTTDLRRKQILQIATGLVQSGTPNELITSLATLVTLSNARSALRFLINRTGGTSTKYLHQQALLLKTIAQHWVRLPASEVAKLATICRNLNVGQTGMTDKNKARLRQFDDPATVGALLNLPSRVLCQIERQDPGDHRTALRAMLALAVEILTVAPMRAANLTGLRIDRHLVRVGRGPGKPLHIVIPAEEMKNNTPFELELPPDTARKLEFYLKFFHPRLSQPASLWLFPNPTGSRRSIITFSHSICSFIQRETGIQMNMHLFRHTAVKLHLDANPDDIETARRILGHKSTATTLRAYAETRTASAFRRYDKVISALRDQAPPVAPGQVRRMRGAA